jgi:hypothetical protein
VGRDDGLQTIDRSVALFEAEDCSSLVSIDRPAKFGHAWDNDSEFAFDLGASAFTGLSGGAV